MSPTFGNRFGGVRVIVRPIPRYEVRWHRKKRIAKKWRKQRGPKWAYQKVNEREILYSEREGIVYCYPRMALEIRTMLKEHARRTSFGIDGAQ